MKNLILTILISLCICGVASADWTEDLSVLKAELGACPLYSINENQVTYATSIQLLGYKGGELLGLYSTDKNMVGIGLGYELNYLEKLGINVPIAKYVTLSVGGYVGSRDFTSEDRSTDYGVWIKPVKIVF